MTKVATKQVHRTSDPTDGGGCERTAHITPDIQLNRHDAANPSTSEVEPDLDDVEHHTVVSVDDPLLNVRQVATYCSVSPSTVRKWIRTGLIRPVYVISDSRIRRSEVNRYITEANHQSAREDVAK